MTTVTVSNPEVIAIVDRGYARDFDHFIGTVCRLSELPHDQNLCVQIRVKSLTLAELEDTARSAREAFTNRTVSLIWNGDARIAMLFGFDGCHQTQDGIGKIKEEASHLIHSASVHDDASLRRAQSCGVDFVIFGPVFEPRWKAVQAQGIDRLKSFVETASVPVIAIGGINSNTLQSVSTTGVCGVAFLSGVMDASDPVDAVTNLQQKWRECAQPALSS